MGQDGPVMSDGGQDLWLRAPGADGQLQILMGWLRHDDALRGCVRTVQQPPSPGEMGGALDAVAVAVGSGGLGVVLANCLSAWTAQRCSGLRITVSTQDGRTAEVDAKRVDPQALARGIERLLNQLRGGGSAVTRLPDPDRSRAVLIGTGIHADSSGLPAIRANLTHLRQVLTDPATGSLLPDRMCRAGDECRHPYGARPARDLGQPTGGLALAPLPTESGPVQAADAVLWPNAAMACAASPSTRTVERQLRPHAVVRPYRSRAAL
ncbi:hypothetical protein ABT168_03815 [Streptomyces sp. NPDC001793]|uniref:effector-associated constant component EACC1 n=1 Tax=Streptomyces sp. NPDC001793 TaxID=3154657 RepID=UPI003319568C